MKAYPRTICDLCDGQTPCRHDKNSLGKAYFCGMCDEPFDSREFAEGCCADLIRPPQPMTEELQTPTGRYARPQPYSDSIFRQPKP